jgi:hypothetical protein
VNSKKNRPDNIGAILIRRCRYFFFLAAFFLVAFFLATFFFAAFFAIALKDFS